MEQLLHYIWHYKMYACSSLRTIDDEAVEVVDSGKHVNTEGVDFLNAKLKIGGQLWVGNICISDATSFKKELYAAKEGSYSSVILQIVERPMSRLFRKDGTCIPQLVLKCPEVLRLRLEQLLLEDKKPPCMRLGVLSCLRDWFPGLLKERLKERRNQFEERLQLCHFNWENALFITLARNFGFGCYGDTFEAWASLLSLHAVDRHRDDLFQIEAMFLGQAGLLASEDNKEAYYLRLQQEYHYLKHLFSLPELEAERWSISRSRPRYSPHIRIAQLARFYHDKVAFLSRVLEAEDLKSIRLLLCSGVSEYWQTHDDFTSPSSRKTFKRLGKMSIQLLIINTVVPFLYSYGLHRGNAGLCQRAMDFLKGLKAEENTIVRSWREVGLNVENAADSQALVQLKKAYCIPKKCLFCPLGRAYLQYK